MRIADYRTQALRTRAARVVSLSDESSRGFGVRVIAQGTWGFAASSQLSEAEVVRVARQAVATAQANSALQREPVQLAPAERHVAIWNTPVRRDAFGVSLEEKVDKLLSINALAMQQPGVTFVDSSLTLVREHKLFASSEGSLFEQTAERLPGLGPQQFATVTNFRWNESPVRVLQNVDAMTASLRASTRESTVTNISVPALRVKEFELSSVSDAV